VPASHRGPGLTLNCRKRINIQPKWHHVVIEIADGEEGEIFFGLFKPYGHEWLEDIETRKAFYETDVDNGNPISSCGTLL